MMEGLNKYKNGIKPKVNTQDDKNSKCTTLIRCWWFVEGYFATGAVDRRRKWY